MTARRPLILDGSNNLKEMTDAQILEVKNLCRYLYGENPSVTLSRVASGGNLGTINDTRKKSGTSATSVSAYPSEATTGEPQTVTVGYARISETRANTTAPVDTGNKALPVYQSSGNIYAMTLTDFYDTFIFDAIDTLTGAVGQPGTYRIHTATTLSGYTAVSSSAVFSDTRADVGNGSGFDTAASTIGGSGTTQDFLTTINNYYLLKANNISKPNPSRMLYIDGTNLRHYASATLDTLLETGIRHVASEETGSKISYNIDGTGTNLGSGMANSSLNGAGNRQTRFVNSNDYRAQEFPNGSVQTDNTYRLKVDQI